MAVPGYFMAGGGRVLQMALAKRVLQKGSGKKDLAKRIFQKDLANRALQKTSCKKLGILPRDQSTQAAGSDPTGSTHRWKTGDKHYFIAN